MTTAGANREPSPAAVELLKFPYPYQAAVTVASDIDNASYDRFTAIHALLCGREVIRPGTAEWQTLGLSTSSAWFDATAGGVPGLGLELADSFFLIGDEVTMGMYREDSAGCFKEDSSDSHNAAEAIRGWIQTGQVDTYHGFLHYTREQVLPLLEDFYAWCDTHGVLKPRVWANHSRQVSPSGLCPSSLRPNRAMLLARGLVRATVGPMLGRARRSLQYVTAWYEGAVPGSKRYINDVLAANGLRYVWLNIDDVVSNQAALPEKMWGDRPSILDIVKMDDGVQYFRFPRCMGKPGGPAQAGLCLRQSAETVDTSCLFTEENLQDLCRRQGTCILFTHWTLKRSFPIQDETIEHFDRVRRHRDAGRIWVAPLGRLLEWTRRRTFLKYAVRPEADRWVIDVEGVDDPISGFATLELEPCRGLAWRVPPGVKEAAVAVAGRRLTLDQVGRADDVCWIR
jgi:hypothetical protein